MSTWNRHGPVSVRRSPSRGVVNYIYLYGKTGMVRAARSPGECRIHLLRGTVCASPMSHTNTLPGLKLSQFAFQMRVFCHLSSNLISTIYSGRVNCSEPLMRAVIAAVGARVSSSQNNGATMLPCSKHESALVFCNPIHDGRACMVLFLSS